MLRDAPLPIIALEISSLGEQNHTGIPNVTKKLAEELLGDTEVDARFFFNRQEIGRMVVEDLIRIDGGKILHWIAGRASFPHKPISLDQPVIGIYPAHKWHRRLFPLEVKIVHDLTCLLVPEFHSVENVEFDALHLLGDLASSDLIVAVSESTRIDLRSYFPQLSHIPCIVAPLAPGTPADVLPIDRATPYVLVLGTLEPRKNVELILEFLSEFSEVLEKITFVFIGRFGWGKSSRELTERYGLADHVASGAIRFLGFVSDEARNQLLAYARCVVYPSLYEGFGLPVVEALSCGTPIITGTGSSLVEAGGAAAYYCDVTSVASFAATLDRCLMENDPDLGTNVAERATQRRRWAASFSWSDTYLRIKDAALDLVENQ
jgi:glycosyltransferase involved in cell wall biosynthesis